MAKQLVPQLIQKNLYVRNNSNSVNSAMPHLQTEHSAESCTQNILLGKSLERNEEKSMNYSDTDFMTANEDDLNIWKIYDPSHIRAVNSSLPELTHKQA